MVDVTSAHELGRTAYEARFAGFTLGDRGVAPAWEQLLPVHQAIWARVEEAVQASRSVAEEPAAPVEGKPTAILARTSVEYWKQLQANELHQKDTETATAWINRLRRHFDSSETSDVIAAPKANGVGTGSASTGLDEAVALFRRTLPHWTAYSIQLHSRGKMTRFVVEISRLQQDRTEELYCAQGPTAVEAMQNVIASVPEASRQPDAPPAEGRAD